MVHLQPLPYSRAPAPQVTASPQETPQAPFT